MALPFISHSLRRPLLLRHRMSDLPSPLKSPTPATLQLASGFIAAPPDVASALALIVVPFMVQSVTSPVVVLRHSTSRLPSPLKSPIPATVHEAFGVAATPPDLTSALEV